MLAEAVIGPLGKNHQCSAAGVARERCEATVSSGCICTSSSFSYALSLDRGFRVSRDLGVLPSAGGLRDQSKPAGAV